MEGRFFHFLHGKLEYGGNLSHVFHIHTYLHIWLNIHKSHENSLDKMLEVLGFQLFGELQIQLQRLKQQL